MSASYDKIREMMEKRLEGTPGLPDFVPQNVRYDPDPETIYVTSNLIPGIRRPEARGPNPKMLLDGVFVAVVCGKKNVGSGDNLRLAQIIAERFEGSTDLVDGATRIGINFAEARGSFDNDTHFCTPVYVSWFTYT